LIDEIKHQEFHLQLDKATDTSRDAHLICFVGFANFTKQKLVDELLFCKPIELGYGGIDLFPTTDNFVSTNNLGWKSVTTYAQMGPMLSGNCCGLYAKSVIQHAPTAAGKWIDSMIYCMALVATWRRTES